jgi:hypothetical protein
MNPQHELDGVFLIAWEGGNGPWMRAKSMRHAQTPEAKEHVLARPPCHSRGDRDPDVQELMVRW